jgi:mannosyl-3-phosphoglycerate phosphatase
MKGFMRRSIILFTDLDGSLLDHDGYSYTGAIPALKMIRRQAIPLVFVTSKTRGEVERLHGEMDIREPFIAENGGGIFFPAGYGGFRIPGAIEQGSFALILLGRPYAEIRRFVEGARERYRIRGFGDMSLGEIVSITGLTPGQARLSKQREFTEPFRMGDPEKLAALREEARVAGFKITRGGRFYHLIGIAQDKGEAVKRTMDIFRDNLGEELLSVGLGDRPNDFPMLSAVDIAVLMPHPDGRYEDFTLPRLMKAPFPGSRGWNEAITGILEGLKAETK